VRVLESVPNVSEGRDPAVVRAVAAALARGGASVLDTHVDADHHRSVFTLVGSDDVLVEGLVAGIAEAARTIDLDRHRGVHPRVGAADVVPVVPLTADELPRARAVALEVARRAGEELELPVFLYGELAGGLRGVQALGLALADGRVQVSTNVVDIDATPTHVLVERIGAEARARRLEVGAGELVGLLPARVVEQAARAAGDGTPLSEDGLPTTRALGAASAALHLAGLPPERVLEWHLARLGMLRRSRHEPGTHA